MALTPAQVHSVAFSGPPVGKRGYHEDQVDAFLDVVEAELARLLEENIALRNQVANAAQLRTGLRSRPQRARYSACLRRRGSWCSPVTTLTITTPLKCSIRHNRWPIG
jgi:DivIVA domain-containing protein